MTRTIDEAFAEWWNREGIGYDPDGSEVHWYDKRRGLAEVAFSKATVQSRNYACDEAVYPEAVTFANGRTVRIGWHDEKPFLLIEQASGDE